MPVTPSLYNTTGAGTGDAVVLGPSRALQVGQHERDRMIRLDSQEMQANAQSAARAKAMQDKIDEDALKADIANVGRFQPYYNESHVLPSKQRLLDQQRKGPLTRGMAFNEATNLGTVGKELGALNTEIDNYLTQTEGTYPKAYDKAQLDKFITDEALNAVRSGKKLDAVDIQNLGEKARQQYHSINAPQLYEDWKKETQNRKNKVSLNTDPTGLLRTKQDVEVNPYIDIIQTKDKNGNVQIQTRFAGDRVFRDQITDPKLNVLYQEQKRRQLSDPAIKADYEKRLAEAGEILDPGKKQRAIDELEHDYFIEPFMGGRQSWATKNLTQEQIRQFHEQRKLTDSEREIQRASELRPIGAENRMKADNTGSRGKALALGGTFTKDDAAGISVGGPGQSVYVMKDGFLQKVPNPGFTQGVGQNYQVTTENIVRGGLFMQDPKTGKTFIFRKDQASRPSLKKMSDSYFSDKGFMDGATMQPELFNGAIADIKKKGLVPVTYGKGGKWVPVEDANIMYSVGRVKPTPFMRLDIEELQATKPKGGAPVLGKNNAKTPQEAVTNIFMKTPGLAGTVYVPLSEAQTARAATQKYVGTDKWNAEIQKLISDQQVLNQDMFNGSKEGTGVKAATPKKKGKQKF